MDLKDFIEHTGYQMQTTFWDDFSVADAFGAGAVIDTYKRCFDEWKGDYKYLTELVMVLNWKIWQHYYGGNKILSNIYDNLFDKCATYAQDNLTEEELRYYYRITD